MVVKSSTMEIQQIYILIVIMATKNEYTMDPCQKRSDPRRDTQWMYVSESEDIWK
jgi:hypothetical protein